LRFTKLCNSLGLKTFDFLKKNLNLTFFSKITNFFKLEENLKKFHLIKKLNHFVELDVLILQMFTILGFETVFHKLIEEN
jgi:hypothetical protein